MTANSTSVIVTAAGSSVRMGVGQKKEYIEIDGTSVLHLALNSFSDSKLFNPLIVTIPKGQKANALDALKNFPRKDDILFIEGGGSRQESVFKGLLALEEYDPEFVLIHDGARPWLENSIIDQIMNGLKKHDACAPAIKSIDAMKIISSSGFIERHLKRDKTYSIQTPQGFKFCKILNAHKLASKDSIEYIDDTEIYSKYFGKVFVVEGSVDNKKVTYSSDLR